jgi:hypothetical protein
VVAVDRRFLVVSLNDTVHQGHRQHGAFHAVVYFLVSAAASSSARLDRSHFLVAVLHRDLFFFPAVDEQHRFFQGGVASGVGNALLPFKSGGGSAGSGGGGGHGVLRRHGLGVGWLSAKKKWRTRKKGT